jgi:hypothetical protein
MATTGYSEPDGADDQGKPSIGWSAARWANRQVRTKPRNHRLGGIHRNDACARAGARPALSPER